MKSIIIKSIAIALLSSPAVTAIAGCYINTQGWCALNGTTFIYTPSENEPCSGTSVIATVVGTYWGATVKDNIYGQDGWYGGGNCSILSASYWCEGVKYFTNPMNIGGKRAYGNDCSAS